MELADAAVVGSGVLGAGIACALAEAGLRVVWVAAQGDAGADPARAGLIDPILGLDFPEALRPLAREALVALREQARELDAEGGPSGFGERGVLELVARPELHAARRRAARLAAHGCRLLERAELGAEGARLPADVVAALLSPGDAWIDPERLRARLAAGARRAGARVVPHTSALGLATAEGSTAGVLLDSGELIAAGDVVLAAETSAHLAPWPPDAPPLEWTQEISRISVAPRPPLEHALVRGSAAVFPGAKGELWLGASEPEPGDLAAALLPELARATLRRAWRSPLARAQDGLPLLGRPPEEQGVLLALAFGRFAPVFASRAGEWIRELLVSGELPAEATPLDATRLGA